MQQDLPLSATKALGSNLALVAALLAALAGCADDPSTTDDGRAATDDGGVATPCTPADCGVAPPCPSVDYGAVAVAPTPPATAANCPSPPTIISAQVQTQAKAGLDALAAARKALLDPGKVTVVACGTGGPMPSTRAQSCVAVFAGGRFFLFDAGDRAARSLEALNLPVRDLSAVFITHFHSDHIADLGEVSSRSWILGRTSGKLPVHGPKGLERVVDGFNQIYAMDDRYREAHHGTDVFKPGTGGMKAHPFADPGASGKLVYNSGGVKITAFTVDHAPIKPAVGYRLEYGGRVVGITGDSVDTPGLAALASGADILVSDVLNKTVTEDFECAFKRLGETRNAQIFSDIRTYHIDVNSLAAVATKAGVKTLMLVHMTPSPADQAQAALFFGNPMKTAGHAGKLVVAEDGTKEVLNVAK